MKLPLFDLRPGAFVAALLGALLLQIGTNFANDYADFRSGADNPDRLGPLRVTQAGYVTAGGMRIAIVTAFAAARPALLRCSRSVRTRCAIWFA